MSKTEHLPPNYAKLDTALRSIGYSFETAVADVIDNSIDASAKNVLVRFVYRKDEPLDLVIWDDGCGMSASELKEAMRFGADVSRELRRLGKFGLGLKLASLSQARELEVFTRKGGALSGRAWLERGVAEAFSSEIFDDSECSQRLAAMLPDRPLRHSGTAVIWSELYRVGLIPSVHDPEQHAQKLLDGLQKYLGLAFHRFLKRSARNQFSIALDIFDGGRRKPGIQSSVLPLDPFGYPESGLKGFPARMTPTGLYAKRLTLVAHVWPPKSNSPEYKLPGGSSARQGFYFYRNDRLIQGGGWNGLLQTEPHTSLARLQIDFSASFDEDLSLDVKKSELQLPPPLLKAIESAETNGGVGFKKYLKLAEHVYRTRMLERPELPLIPETGIPARLSRLLRKELLDSPSRRFRALTFEWAALEEDTFFEIDRDSDTIYLNQAFRRRALHGMQGSVTDAPVMKCLLFLLLSESLEAERLGSKLREFGERANRILVAAVKYERAI